MSLSIFDVDEISCDIIDDNEVKTFVKYCGYDGEYPLLKVGTGTSSKELCDNDVVTCFKLIYGGACCTVSMDKDKHELELIFKGWKSCDAFLQALEFAIGVLRETKNRLMFQQRESVF